MFAFSLVERELVAQVARYHRKSLPSQKHIPFQALSEKDRLLVTRLADGLDRRRAGSVQGIACEFCDMALTIEAKCSEDITVEIFSGNSKKDLFEKAFSAEVVFAT